MYRLKLALKYLKAFWNFIIRNESLRLALYEIAVSKYVFGNQKFKDFIEVENVINKLNTAQDQLDKATRLLDNKSTQETVEDINAKKTGPFKDIKARLHCNRHGKSNHGISLGIDTKISNMPVQFGIGFGDDKKVAIGPLQVKF
jgi:hypothetical protein